MRNVSTQRGQALIEFAVVLPLLIFFLFAIFEVGLALDRRATLQQAVREGARYAAINYDASSGGFIRTRTAAQSQGLLSATNLNANSSGSILICYTDVDGIPGINVGDQVFVKAKYTYKTTILDSVFNLLGVPKITQIDIKPVGAARLESSPSAAQQGSLPLC